jgi:hypothetical protein
MEQPIDNIQIDPDTGKWISVFIQPEHMSFVLSLKLRLRDRKLKVSQNDIAQRILELGIQNIDKEAVLNNPLSLWEDGK